MGPAPRLANVDLVRPMSDHRPDLRSQPSPYVSIYMARRQAQHVQKALREAAADKAPSHPLWAALKRIEAALAENNPSEPGLAE